MDETFDRIVNCPLCGGTLTCFIYDWSSEFNWDKAYTNRRNEGEGYRWRIVDCPLCAGEGTAFARLLPDQEVGCSDCRGSGSVQRVIELDVGARKEAYPCTSCRGLGNRTRRRIEIKTHSSAREKVYFYIGDNIHSLSKGQATTQIDLEGAAELFFAKWHARGTQ